MGYILLYRKEKTPLVILHPPSATLRWELENIRGEYKSSLSFKPETINIRWNPLNERNKNGKLTRRSFASGKDHANGYESAFAFIRLIFASLAQYFSFFIQSKSLCLSVNSQKKRIIWKWLDRSRKAWQWASWIRSWRAICVQVKAITINSKSERKAGNIVCYTAVFSLVTQRCVTRLKTAV